MPERRSLHHIRFLDGIAVTETNIFLKATKNALA
jgi:hypothetical protein